MISVGIEDRRVSVSDGGVRLADFIDTLSLLQIEIYPSGTGGKVTVEACVVIQGNPAGVMRADADSVGVSDNACDRGLVIRVPSQDGKRKRIPSGWLGKTLVARDGRLCAEGSE